MRFRLIRRVVFVSSLTSLPILAGCGNGFNSSAVTPAAIVVTGNWQFASADSNAAKLPSLSGELTGTNSTVSGILHSNAPSACISPKTSFAVTGSADAKNQLTLTGANVAGGALSITGVLSQDGKSLSNATYTVSGGSCSFAKPALASAQIYAPITGHYVGTFVDSDGDQISIQADLTQTPTANTDGDFQLSGSGTFPQNPCYSSPVTVSNTQVTGGSFTMTYADAQTGNAVTGTGTFSSDAKTLTLSGWQSAGPCGSAAGTGTLTRQ